jgi:hypothetical protein
MVAATVVGLEAGSINRVGPSIGAVKSAVTQGVSAARLD